MTGDRTAGNDLPSTPGHGDPNDAVLAVGDLVLLRDGRGRRHLIRLEVDGEFHSHAGITHHHLLIGNQEGIEVSSTKGQRFRAFRPTFEDYVLEMPRGAQVIYPKDLAPMMILGDIAPGHRVFESGIGSGALSMMLLRAGATVTGYEIRHDFASRAMKNITGWLGDVSDRYQLEIRSAYEPIDGTYDRCMLDLPEPWQVVPHAEAALRPGGVLVAYTPSIAQVMRLREVLQTTHFIEEQTVEVLHRTWHVDGQAVRPDHRMVAHTAFLTRARLAATDRPAS